MATNVGRIGFDPAPGQRVRKRVDEERHEFDTLQARYQQRLDQWWQAQRAAAAEERRLKQQLDPYGLHLYD